MSKSRTKVPQSAVVSVRVRDWELEAFRLVAASLGESVSEYVRRVVAHDASQRLAAETQDAAA